MFKVKLTSNFFISLTALVALGVAGCGGSGEGSGGAGGKGGNSAGGKGGTAGAGAVGGGKGGTAPLGTGGAAGGPGGSAGGSIGSGGSAGAGTGGIGGAAGGVGGHAPNCGETVVCTVGASRCDSGAPQTCMMDPTTLCPFWATTANQPAQCSANQTCVAATGTCVCKDAPGCGATPAAGDFCPTAGAATHSSCVMQADGCFTVTDGTACAAGQTCNAAAGTVVAAGTACGCSPVSADQTGKTTQAARHRLCHRRRPRGLGDGRRDPRLHHVGRLPAVDGPRLAAPHSS